ncbi:hypothetical protein CXK92_13275 [Stutzerimonas stutzeri]|uniref:Uncharacterized protein n=1 Tax=Stutzerimonas stutzeri TaxID=316 RepID=A0A2N8RZ47_STUST|nr:hypothetical protein CXK92_13275 [Stutzerimonas stutzeri]
MLWRRYWSAYGGAKALFKSFYILLALALTIVNYGSWSQPGWWEVIISSMPTLLGFTLAGMAVFLSMDSGFSKFIAGSKKTDKPSPFISLISSFTHFIVVQVIAFTYALSAKSLYFTTDWLPNWYYKALPTLNLIGGAFGYFAFLYAIMLILGATFAIFRISGWYEMYIGALKNTESDKEA